MLEKPEKETQVDGRILRAIGRGTVSLVMKLPGGRTESRKLLETLNLPELSFNLVSVSKVSECGRVFCFLEAGYEKCHDKVLVTPMK